MLTFFVRRVIGAILVMIAVTFIVFVIFIVVPGGDTAQRIAGKNATPQNIINIRHDWKFDKPFYDQYWVMLQKMFSGSLVSYTSQQNVVSQIVQGMPATFSLTIGAGIIWLFFGILVGVISAVRAGRWSDRLITVLALIGISMPVFWLGIVCRYYLAEGGWTTIFPDGEYAAITQNPLQWFYHLILPWLVLAVLFIGFYGRVLRGNILDTINEDYVRTARAKGLPQRTILVRARAAHVADPDRDALRPRLRVGARRRRDPHRDRVRSARRRPVRGAVDQQLRPAADHGRHAVRRVLHHRVQRVRRSLLRVPRPANPADVMAERLLEVKDLGVEFTTEDGVVHAVDGVSFELERGKVLGIVGESGSGKSVTAMTIMGLTRDVNASFRGEVNYQGRNLLEISDTEMQNFRGNEIGMIFQDPMTSLNPVYRIGEQIVEAIRAHETGGQADRAAARGRVAAAGRDPEPGVARRRLPASVLGRHAAARDDRDGALVQSRRFSLPTSRRPRST